MRIGKVVSLGFVALTLHLAGCASSTTDEANASAPSSSGDAAESPATHEKSTFAAPLPATEEQGSGEVRVDELAFLILGKVHPFLIREAASRGGGGR